MTLSFQLNGDPPYASAFHRLPGFVPAGSFFLLTSHNIGLSSSKTPAGMNRRGLFPAYFRLFLKVASWFFSSAGSLSPNFS